MNKKSSNFESYYGAYYRGAKRALNNMVKIFNKLD